MSDAEISAANIEKQQTLLRTELKLPKIRTSNQELSDFNPKKIYDVYVNEAGLDAETAEYYTQIIMADLNKLYIQNRLHEVSTRMLRELMCAHAIQQGDFATRNKLSVVGLPIKDVENLFFNYNSENSNHVPSEEFIHKAMADVMNEQYSFSTLYNFNTPWGNPAYSHMNADIYIHDRDYPARPFCFQHSARFIFRNGLYIDGTGRHVNVSRPPKNLEVAIRQVCEFLGAASRNWNGGQSFRNLFWELGPFLETAAKNNSSTKNLGGVEIPTAIVQAAQMMRYEPNHILVGRGSQAAFSSLSNFAVPPKYLTEDTDIVLPGGQVIKGSYADYKEYVLKFWYAYLFESARGDANGGMFHWMKDDIGIKPSWFKDPELQQYIFEPLMKYVAKFGGPYIYNVKNVSDDEVACTSCCSLVLATESPEDYELARQGTLGMGALQCGSFNLPRIAYLAGGDDAKVYEMIESRMNLLAEVMKAKKSFMKKIIATGVAPFLTQPRLRGKDPAQYFDIEKQSYLLSFCGMNEFTKAHMGYELHESKEAHNYAMKILMHMMNYAKKLSDETGLNLAIWRQPGESLKDTEKVLICDGRGYRFDEIGTLVESYFKKYPDAIQISAQGNEYLDLEKLGVDLKTVSLTNFKTSEKSVTALVKHPKRDVLKVKLTGGKEISVTPNHSLFTLNEDTLEIDEASASDLKEGSWVVTLDKMNIKGKQFESALHHLDKLSSEELKRVFISGKSIPSVIDATNRNSIGAWLDTTDRKTALKDVLSGFKSRQIIPLDLCKSLGIKFNSNSGDFSIHIGTRNYPANLELSYDVGYLVGVYIAEGSLKEGAISMTDKDAIENVKRIVAGITTSDYEVAEKWGEKSTMPLYFFDASEGFMKYLNLTLGLELETSHNKSLPPAIMAANEGCLKGFIKGYFEGDGTLGYNTKKHDFNISFSTASRRLANDIVFVLARLGVGSKICLKKGGKEYTITTSNRKNALKLAEILGTQLPPALEKSTTTNPIPHAGRHIRALREKYGIASERIDGINGRSLRDIETGNGMITKLKLQELVRVLEPAMGKDEAFTKLKMLAFSDIEFEQVISLEQEGKFHVYDLEVRPNGEAVENFTAGFGLVLSHNTMPGKFAQDDYKKFNGRAVLQGNPKAGAAYYSNFTHVNVNSGLSVFDKIKNEAPFHALSPSNLLHIWLGEASPDPDALWDMTKKILDKSLTTYFAYTREITVCNNCKTSHSGVVSHCSCGAGPKDLVVNSRIVGYYSAVGTVEAIMNWRKNQARESLKGSYWQPHKFAEFNNRVANYSGQRLSKLEAN